MAGGAGAGFCGTGSAGGNVADVGVGDRLGPRWARVMERLESKQDHNVKLDWNERFGERTRWN